jgi:antitoxin CptB
MDAVRKNRLKWMCRRGLLELDIVLERYLAKYPEDREIEGLLALADNDLWDIVIGRSDRYDPKLNELVARLRAA